MKTKMNTGHCDTCKDNTVWYTRRMKDRGQKSKYLTYQCLCFIHTCTSQPVLLPWLAWAGQDALIQVYGRRWRIFFFFLIYVTIFFFPNIYMRSEKIYNFYKVCDFLLLFLFFVYVLKRCLYRLVKSTLLQ